MLLKLLCLALGGAAGTLARFGVATLTHDLTGRHPLNLGTLAVNALGCLLFGLVFAWVHARVAPDRPTIQHPEAALLLIGFLGAFTTFSTYAFDTIHAGQTKGLPYALANLALHNTLGLALLLAGLTLGTRLFGKAA